MPDSVSPGGWVSATLRVEFVVTRIMGHWPLHLIVLLFFSPMRLGSLIGERGDGKMGLSCFLGIPQNGGLLVGFPLEPQEGGILKKTRPYCGAVGGRLWQSG